MTWIRNYVYKKLCGYILTNISYGSSILAWIFEKFNLKRNLLWHGGGAGEIVWRELSNYHNKAKKHTTALWSGLLMNPWRKRNERILPPVGLEHTIIWSEVWCSTNWATEACNWIRQNINFRLISAFFIIFLSFLDFCSFKAFMERPISTLL